MADLAQKAKVSPATVSDVERNKVQPTLITLAKLRKTLEAAGVEFIPGDEDGIGEGVRVHTKHQASTYLGQ